MGDGYLSLFAIKGKWVHIQTIIYIYIYIIIYTYIFVYMYTCYICIYIYIYGRFSKMLVRNF